MKKIIEILKEAVVEGKITKKEAIKRLDNCRDNLIDYKTTRRDLLNELRLIKETKK